MFIFHFAWKSAMMCVVCTNVCIQNIFKCFSFLPYSASEKFHFFFDHLRKVFSNNKIYIQMSIQCWLKILHVVAGIDRAPKIHSPETFYRIIFVKSVRFGCEICLNCQSKWFMNKIQILYGNVCCESKDQNLERKKNLVHILIDFMMWINASTSTFFYSQYNWCEYCGFWIENAQGKRIPSSKIHNMYVKTYNALRRFNCLPAPGGEQKVLMWKHWFEFNWINRLLL